ncbi:hypothetical protein GWI34_17550 [Actinomadura sp. DSM 109109]|nr:hypothetical protein [Actinomadura lepetitiana]
MRRPRPQYVAAGLIGVVGLVVAVLIAVLGLHASGYVPTKPTSYTIGAAGRTPGEHPGQDRPATP